MASFVCIGDVSQDNFFFIDEASVHCDLNQKNCTLEIKYGEKIPVTRFGVSCGGNGANVATGLAKLGVSVELLTTFGGDERGAWLKRKLLENGVGLENSMVLEKRESNISSIVIFKKERTILTYHGKGENLIKTLPPCRWIYVTSVLEYRDLLEQRGTARLAFNPSAADLRKDKDFLAQIVAMSEVLIVNKEEQEMLGMMGPKITAVTDGLSGVDVFDGGKKIHGEPVPSEVLETTGAGDAFSSGFLAGLFWGKDLETAMKWGILNASSVVTKLGAQEGLLRREDLGEIN